MPFALLLAIAELAEEHLHRGLARLQAAEFLYEMSLFPELEYTFKHASTHEVAYGEPAARATPDAPRLNRRRDRARPRRSGSRSRRSDSPITLRALSSGTRP